MFRGNFVLKSLRIVANWIAYRLTPYLLRNDTIGLGECFSR